MSEAVKIPHFYFMEEIDVTRLREMRNEIIKESGIKISYMPLLLKAFSLSLKEYPMINSTYNVD